MGMMALTEVLRLGEEQLSEGKLPSVPYWMDLDAPEASTSSDSE